MNFTRYRLAMWALLLTGVFFLLVATMSRVMLLTILNGVFLGVAVCAIIVYAPLVYISFVRNKLDRVSQLSLGIGLLFTSIIGQRLYWIIWHVNGTPQDWVSNPVLAAIAYISIIGGCLFVTAPGYPPATSLEPFELWGTNRKLLLSLGAIGGVIAFALSVFNGGAF